jgi:hypothetical protein
LRDGPLKINKRAKKVKKRNHDKQLNYTKEKTKESKSFGKVQISLLMVMITLSMVLVFFNMN